MLTLEALTPEKLADELTMLGLEVDAVTPLYEELGALKTAHRLIQRAPPGCR